MATVALIGGIGSGKSTVLSMFAHRGAACIGLDEIGHGILESPAVKDEIRSAFGSGVFDENGRIVRSKLAAAAFDTGEHTAVLNAITHPAIMAECFRRIDEAKRGHAVVVVEVTSGTMTREAFSWADAVVAVAAPEDVRLERACARGDQARDDVAARMELQASDAERAAIADFEIDNGSSLDQAALEVDRVWRALAESQPSC